LVELHAGIVPRLFIFVFVIYFTKMLASCLLSWHSFAHGRSDWRGELIRGWMMKAAHTAGPWNVVKSFNGYVITRTWSSGFYQRMKTPHLRTEAEALAFLTA
jgi:hypothetical protein